jgi:hypothetical protein
MPVAGQRERITLTAWSPSFVCVGGMLLIAAALAGLVAAMPLWIPAGIVIGAAALVLGQATSAEGSSAQPA